LAANKEYQFMEVLYTNGFSVPEPYDYSRHSVLMQWIDGVPMRAIRKHPNHQKLYSDLMNFIVRLANNGLIHCDFNEFNIIIVHEEAEKDQYRDNFVVIDFPQCISIGHVDAEFYFKRDVDCIRRFFKKKIGYEPQQDSSMIDTDGYGDGYKYAYPVFSRDVKRINNLDVAVEASGFSKKRKNDRDLEDAVECMRADLVSDAESDEDAEEGYDEEFEDDYDSEDYEEFDEEGEEVEEQDLDEENEKIIEALQTGVKELKMDKMGNYILEE
jgi:RIO kinase 2